MNVNMWEHPATQENMEMLRARGVHIVSPDEGYLACGMTGAGRLASVEAIAASGLRSARDPARSGWRNGAHHRRPYLRGSGSGALSDQSLVGKDGLCARWRGGAARRSRGAGKRPDGARGAAGVERVTVRSTEEMHRAVLANLSAGHHRDHGGRRSRLSRRGAANEQDQARAGGLTLELEATPDILADVSRSKGDRILVGFAAETDQVAEHARQKLAAKAADLIVANDVTAAGAGFDHETNIVTLYHARWPRNASAAYEQTRSCSTHP